MLPIDDGWLGYLAVLVAAATPWIELAIVIPAGIAVGLNPAAVAALAFIGNAAPVLGIVAAYDWWQRRRVARAPQGVSAPAPPAGDGGAHEEYRPASSGAGRGGRARRIFARWGLPGLALAAPATTGIHLATAIALGFRAPKSAVTLWMVGSLGAWTVGASALSLAGVELLGG